MSKQRQRLITIHR